MRRERRGIISIHIGLMIASIVYNVLFAFVVSIVPVANTLKIRFGVPTARTSSAVKIVIIVANLTAPHDVLIVAISSFVRIARNAHIALVVSGSSEESFAFLTNNMIETHTLKLSSN